MNAAVIATLLFASLWPATGEALPDLRSPRDIGSVRVYPDHERPSRFYFAPGPLAIARDASDRPDLHFLQMRYVGTAAYGNEGETGSFSTLTLGIQMDGPSTEELALARRFVSKIAKRATVELRPLPVTRFDVELSYARLDGAAPNPLPAGHFEAGVNAAGQSGSRAFWKERVYTVSLDPRTSQLFWTALHEGMVVVSLSYAFYTDGIVPEGGGEVRISGDEEAAELLGQAVSDRVRGPGRGTRQILADATGIRVDAESWPELFQRVDFNEEVPPGYAALQVYCFDFKDALRPDLFYKKVEVEAVGVGGRSVAIETKFLFSQPDLYARTIRFPVAVQLDRSYRYRVSTAWRDGRSDVGEWLERNSWGRILDVTTRPAAGDDATANLAEPEA